MFLNETKIKGPEKEREKLMITKKVKIEEKKR